MRGGKFFFGVGFNFMVDDKKTDQKAKVNKETFFRPGAKKEAESDSNDNLLVASLYNILRTVQVRIFFCGCSKKAQNHDFWPKGF